MNVYVLYDPGDDECKENVRVYQTKEKLYHHLVNEISSFYYENHAADSARLLFDKGDYEDLLDLYEEVTDVRLSVFETKVIK